MENMYDPVHELASTAQGEALSVQLSPSEIVGIFEETAHLDQESASQFSEYLDVYADKISGMLLPKTKATVEYIRGFLIEHFGSLDNPLLDLSQAQKAALYKTLGWYHMQDKLVLKDPVTVADYVHANGRAINYDRQVAVEAAFSQVATAVKAFGGAK